MNHRIKTRIFKILSLLPPNIGDTIYHSIQAQIDRRPLEERIRRCHKSFEKTVGLLTELEIDLAGKRVLEIGSGWLPIMPFLFKYIGSCSQVITYDINEHYNRNHIRRLIQVFTKEFNITVSTNEQDKYLLPDGILYKPKSNVTQLGIRAASVDVIFSRWVLQYVPPEQILRLHKDVLEVLSPGGVIIHFVGTSDDRAFSDKSISQWDFLRYSGPEWNNLQTRFFYHNRLRMPQYLEIFKNAGLSLKKIGYSVCRTKSEQHAKFQRVKLHPDFQRFSFEELTAGGLVFVLSKEDPSDSNSSQP
jgi:hypothetical protein